MIHIACDINDQFDAKKVVAKGLSLAEVRKLS